MNAPTPRLPTWRKQTPPVAVATPERRRPLGELVSPFTVPEPYVGGVSSDIILFITPARYLALTSTRADQVDRGHVLRLMAAMQRCVEHGEPAAFPPLDLVIQETGPRDGFVVRADGRHRAAAAELAGLALVPVVAVVLGMDGMPYATQPPPGELTIGECALVLELVNGGEVLILSQDRGPAWATRPEGVRLGQVEQPARLSKASPQEATTSRPGLVLRPSKTKPGVKRWMRSGDAGAEVKQGHKGEGEGEGEASGAAERLRWRGRDGQQREGQPLSEGERGAAVLDDRGQLHQVNHHELAEGARDIFEIELPSLPEGFNDLPKEERAELTAKWAEVRQEITRRYDAHRELYEVDTPIAAVAAAHDHLDALVAGGWAAERNARYGHAMVDALGGHLRAIDGVGAEDVGEIMQLAVMTLVHQEFEAARRTLGDHGLRHIGVNVQQLDGILDSIEASGDAFDPRDRAGAVMAMIVHDIGYTIPAIARGGFGVKNNYHPQASARIWEEMAQGAALGRVLGGNRVDRLADTIAKHSSSEVDWERDAIGTATRLADNLHLFADKMPEVLFDDPRAMEVMIKLHLAKQAGLDWQPVRDAMVEQINGREDVPDFQRRALAQAAQELSPAAPKFLVSRLAGRGAQFRWDAESSTMHVDVEQSPLREKIGQVFGADEPDRQFIKLLSDFGKTPEQVMKAGPPPTVALTRGRDGVEEVKLQWVQPSTPSSDIEADYARTLERVTAEWESLKDADAQGAWLAQLRKAAVENGLLPKNIAVRPHARVSREGKVSPVRPHQRTVLVHADEPAAPAAAIAAEEHMALFGRAAHLFGVPPVPADVDADALGAWADALHFKINGFDREALFVADEITWGRRIVKLARALQEGRLLARTGAGKTIKLVGAGTAKKLAPMVPGSKLWAAVERSVEDDAHDLRKNRRLHPEDRRRREARIAARRLKLAVDASFPELLRKASPAAATGVKAGPIDLTMSWDEAADAMRGFPVECSAIFIGERMLGCDAGKLLSIMLPDADPTSTAYLEWPRIRRHRKALHAFKVMHSHPNDSLLSIEDCVVAGRGRVEEMVAVTRAGEVVLRPGAAGWRTAHGVATPRYPPSFVPVDRDGNDLPPPRLAPIQAAVLKAIEAHYKVFDERAAEEETALAETLYAAGASRTDVMTALNEQELSHAPYAAAIDTFNNWPHDEYGDAWPIMEFRPHRRS